MTTTTTTSFEHQFQSALDAHREGKLEDAQTQYKDCLTRMPGHGESLFNLGMVEAQLGHWQKACEYYKEALTIYPDEARIHFNTAIAYLNREDFGVAVYHLQQVLIHDTKHFDAHHMLACVHHSRDELEDAKRHFLQALSLQPDDPQLNANYAILCLQEKDLTTAREHLSRAVNQSKEGEFLYNLAFIEEMLGETDSAIANYQEAIEVMPVLFEAYYRLSLLFYRQGLYEKAQLLIETALRLKPNNESLLFIKKTLLHKHEISSLPSAYVAELFDHYGEHYEAHLQQTLDYQVPELLQHYLKNELANRIFTSALELGCGTGLCGPILAGHATSLVGMDLSEKMLEQAEKKHCYRELACRDVESFLKEYSDSFELVAAMDVLNYIGELENLFHLAFKAMQNKGLFIFTIEQGSNAVLSKQLRFTHDKDQVRALARQAGFTCLSDADVTLRCESDVPVQGVFFVLEK